MVINYFSPELNPYDGETIDMNPYRNGKWVRREDYDELQRQLDLILEITDCCEGCNPDVRDITGGEPFERR